MTWNEILSEAHSTTIKMLEQKYDGMTNGEVIESLFPNVGTNFSNIIDLNLWWKAKYKKKEEVYCNHTDAEIAKSFIEDVETVKDQLPTTKNNLEVDTISRADAIRVASGYCHPSNVAKELMKLPPVNAIQLPDNATNGDAILAVFPNTEHYKNNGIINTDIDDGTLFNEDWWEAPYKRNSVDKK